MKKMKFVLPLALMSTMFFVSCKKEYTCKCDINSSGLTMTTEHNLGKQSKKDAKSACDQMSVNIGSQTVECKLK